MSSVQIIPTVRPATRGTATSRKRFSVTFKSVDNIEDPRLNAESPASKSSLASASSRSENIASPDSTNKLSKNGSPRRGTLTARDKVSIIIRAVSAKYRDKIQARLDLERTIENIKASDTVFYKNGIELWSRETQTEELQGLELNEADLYAHMIRKDIELHRNMMKVTCDLRLKESRVLLYSVMSKRLKELEVKYKLRLKSVEKDLKTKLRRQVEEAEVSLEYQNQETLAEATLNKKILLERVRQTKEKFDDMYRANNQEYQTLRYKSAKLYVLLKKFNVPGVQEANEHLDAQRVEIVTMVDKLRNEIAKCDEEIRTEQAKLFKLEEEVDQSQQGKSRKDIVGIVQRGRESVYMKLTGSTLTSPNQLDSVEEDKFVADEGTKNYVKAKLMKDFDLYFETSLAETQHEYADAQKKMDHTLAEWDIKFKSANSMFNAEKRHKLLKTQSRILGAVSKLVIEGTKRMRQDKEVKVALTGKTILELLQKEVADFKAKFRPVLWQFMEVLEDREQKKLDDERKKAEEKAAAEAAAAAEAKLQAQQKAKKGRRESIGPGKIARSQSEIAKQQSQPPIRQLETNEKQTATVPVPQMLTPNSLLSYHENLLPSPSFGRSISVMTPSPNVLIPSFLASRGGLPSKSRVNSSILRTKSNSSLQKAVIRVDLPELPVHVSQFQQSEILPNLSNSSDYNMADNTSSAFAIEISAPQSRRNSKAVEAGKRRLSVSNRRSSFIDDTIPQERAISVNVDSENTMRQISLLLPTNPSRRASFCEPSVTRVASILSHQVSNPKLLGTESRPVSQIYGMENLGDVMKDKGSIRSRNPSVLLPEDTIHQGWHSQYSTYSSVSTVNEPSRASSQVHVDSRHFVPLKLNEPLPLNPEFKLSDIGTGKLLPTIGSTGRTQSLHPATEKSKSETLVLPALDTNRNNNENIRPLTTYKAYEFEANLMFHSNNLTDQYYQSLLEQQEYLRNVKRSVAKGLYGVDMKKPKHSPPSRLGIAGNTMSPVSDGIRFPYLGKRLEAREAYKDIDVRGKLRRKHERAPVVTTPHTPSKVVAQPYIPNNKNRVTPGFNIRPWSSESLYPHGYFVVQDGASYDINTEEQVNGIFGTSLIHSQDQEKLAMVHARKFTNESIANEIRKQTELPPCLTGINIITKKHVTYK
ncbi:hypothetical protein HDU79_008139 [Rhizoclosmatium sp. JEL0117]|nr:hypothetical protein HDU79_008139 [Rhizoclosmatium sp. JEL0117]